MPGLFQSAYQPHGNVDRTYDYELKYKADEPEQAADPGARIWKIYLDEADSFDSDMLQGFRDNIDALLVFAALFSAVVTTFTVETKDFLQPDYAQITVVLLAEQLQLLRTGGNVTAMSSIPSSTIVADTEKPSSLNIWMAGLFFTSLSFSLTTALLSILVKQWLTSYSSLTSGDTQLRCLIRQFRFNGLENWKLPQIIGFLPLLLHFSLALFLVGLSLFVFSLYPPLSAIVISVTTTTFALYISGAVLPAVYKDCPFRIPILQDLIIFVIWILFHAQLLFKTLFARHLDFVQVYFPLWMESIPRPSLDPWIPSLSESQHVENVAKYPIVTVRNGWNQVHARLLNAGELVTGCLDWLFHQTSNASVRKTTILAASDLVYDRGWIPTIPSSWFDMIPEACNEFFTQHCMRPVALYKFLQLDGRSLRRPGDINIYPADILERAVRSKKSMILDDFISRGLPVDFVQHPSSKRILVLAIENGDIGLVQRLMNYRAKCNVDGEDKSPLMIAMQNRYPDIASHLLQGGAIMNLDFKVGALDPLAFADLLRLGAKCDVNGEGAPPLCIAVQARNHKIVSLLLENGALVDNPRDDGMTALHIAVSSTRHHERIVTLLLEHGALVNSQRHDGRTPLHTALTRRPYDIRLVKLLLDHNADPGIQDNKGKIPLHIALRNYNFKICEMLVSHPNAPDVDTKDKSGSTPL